MFNLAAAIVLACGVADNPKTARCWDVYNNCTLNKAFKRGEDEATKKDFDECRLEFTAYEKTIIKEQGE